jgi:secreted trypsin-like serine protease
MTIRRWVLGLGFSATLFTACANDVVIEENTRPATQPILNGDPASRSEHQAVVSLHQRVVKGKKFDQVQSNIFCSGTLIAPDVVMSAAHCLQGETPKSVAVYVGNDPTIDLAAHVYLVSEVAVHPGYSSFSLQNDIALVRLAAPVTETIPVAHLSASEALGTGDIGSLLNFAGFGETENGTYDLRLQADGTLEGFGCGHATCSDGGDPATQIWYQQDASANGGTETGPCYGDSGGPAFAYLGPGTYDNPRVAGITSYGDANCTVYGVSTKVDAYTTFIDDFIAGGSGGGGEGGSDPGGCTDGQVGDSCSTGADCCSGKCAGKPGSKSCK